MGEPGAHLGVRASGSVEVLNLAVLTAALSWAPTYLWYCVALSSEEGLLGGIN